MKNDECKMISRQWLCAALTVCLLLAFLTGCGDGSGEPETAAPLMEVAEFPKLDGSTAAIPLGEALYRYFTGASEEEAAREISFQKTDYAYYNLMSGFADLLLVYEGGQEVMDELKARGENLEQKEIGVDALVFLTSEENPVDNLSLEDIRKIYSGEYDNWAQVGGADMPIAAYQRNEESGSQALMRKLVMYGTEMADPEQVPAMGEMGGLIEVVADYRNDADALGYSVYYYAANMYAVENVKLLAVDGVMPSDETIADGTYPLTNPFYAIMGQRDERDPAQQIYDFLTTPEGKELMREAGYVPAP